MVCTESARQAVPIGAGCKICSRDAFPRRAFPYLGRRVVVDENTSNGLPYSSGHPGVLTGGR
jgi:predicted transcriptional regulator